MLPLSEWDRPGGVPDFCSILAMLRLKAGGSGGSVGLETWRIVIGGGTATIVSLALVSVPPPEKAHILNFEANLIGQSAAILGVGFLLYRRKTNRR